MKNVQIFDLAMCCSTGVCGTEVDQALVEFAADVDWLRKQGAAVERFNLAQQPQAFASRATIRNLLHAQGEAALPVILVDDEIKHRGTPYPSREQLAQWAGITPATSIFSEQVAELVAIGASIASNCEPCFEFHFERARKIGVADADVRQAVDLAQKVKDAPARALVALARRHLDKGVTAQACCKQRHRSFLDKYLTLGAFTSLLTDGKLAEGFDHIVFDTAPTGHTIRLLQLPGAWTSFLEAGQGDASCLGSLAGLEKQRSQYEAAVAALADPLRTRLVLVARAQRSALQEAARTHEELAALGLSRQHLVINGILPAPRDNQDPLAAAIVARERAAIDALPQSLCDLPQDRVALKSFNVVGLAALRDLLLPAEGGDTGRVDAPPHLGAPSLAQLVDEIEADGRGW